MFPKIFSLDKINGRNGFKIYYVLTSFSTGFPTSSTGDVNGDGIDDILVGDLGALCTKDETLCKGQSFAIYGKDTGFPEFIELSSLDESAGFKIDGLNYGDENGRGVCSIDNANSDELSDLLLNALVTAIMIYPQDARVMLMLF